MCRKRGIDPHELVVKGREEFAKERALEGELLEEAVRIVEHRRVKKLVMLK